MTGTDAAGKNVTIEVRDDAIILTSRGQGTSRARLLDGSTIEAIDWGWTGTISHGVITWSHGPVWSNFDPNLFDAAFGNVETLPFPNLKVDGKTKGRGKVSIEAKGGEIIATNSDGETSRVQRIAANTILAIDWNWTGTVKKGRIYWSNGVIWRGLDSRHPGCDLVDVRRVAGQKKLCSRSSPERGVGCTLQGSSDRHRAQVSYL
jgi:hypothetical protein